MRAVCVDALNPLGRPSSKQLKHVGLNGVRVEMRDDDMFYKYEPLQALARIHSAYLVGPSTGNVSTILPHLHGMWPDLFIIGNEPDGLGESSWTMTVPEYAEFWNDTTRQIRAISPVTPLCAAGMLNDVTFLKAAWPKLLIKPDLVNKHYPNNAGELQQFSIFNRPVCCFEWCWRTAKQNEMTDWLKMLSVVTLHHAWFCWSDNMMKSMGLVGGRSNKSVYHAYYALKAALNVVR